MPREGKAKVLTENEFKRLLKIVLSGKNAKRNTALLYFSFGLGLRAKEMSLLKINHVLNESNDSLFEEINLTGNMTKGDKQRHIYLTNPKVQKVLLDYIEERKENKKISFNYSSPLFLSQKGGKFSPNSLQQLFSQLYKQAGIIGASSHSGRRSFATKLIERGVDIKAVSRLMGHASISMTAQYVEDNPVRLKRIAEELVF
ncbi:MAG: site-specific integrase [Proteobacteria bacterium]|nr:site-specific integrase [Pseudomonadota bacterium]